ncbi:SAM domain (Sterile alpha motif) domain containing protein [Acanthamoeba castellanii str. Neff]|uniref:SAM domain (Sterile alpha motif) domain containing protein n=1 Tax=Acanthamoeba castellanii (strain ATCC 30010 / Neff) TaxID=1257118 RepID=L8HCS1_ACACF|nr:SAM domain (Sterile alpha motif) domain containing protein [Acanthamoeba castellanii str. Neff]ELR22543.1 SAM domain (Sterile alpha motif) domain containing protein [Acanthamoeba castellanii str. Neff]
MGQELTKAVFTPPPPSYDDTLEGLAWIPSIVSTAVSTAASRQPTEAAPPIPTVFLDWKGANDESAFFTLLYCNGSASDLGLTLPWLKILRDTLHVNVVAFDYTGFGLHEGSPSESACYDDARAVYAWLTLSKGIHSDKLIVSFAGLVLQSPFTSILALDVAHKFHVGVPDMFDSLRKLKRISCHVLVAHGQNDNLVPKTHPKKMVRKLENLWKRLELEGVGHHDVEASHDCLDALVEFVEFLMPNGTSIKSEIVVPKRYTDTPEQIVSGILGRTGMEQYTSLFLSQGYMDPFIISSLEEIDIVAMGISDQEHIKAVCKAVQHVKTEGLASSQGFSLSSRADSEEKQEGEGASEQEAKETQKSNGKRSKKTSLPSMKQVEASLKPSAIKFEELAKERTLKSGFFEEVYMCQWNGQTVVARNMPAKAHQYEQFARYTATVMPFKHPNLLVSKWMEKGSLHDVLLQEGASLSPLQRVQIALGAAEALLYLHSQSPAPFLHNDFTSRNVLLDGSLRPRVNNFGLARPPSFLWMAPEVFSKKQYSTAADVFSLGVVLWEIFTSCRPWEGTPPSIAVLRVAKDSARLPLPLAKPNENDEEVVEAWVSLIRSCWHADPARRPSAKSVVERVRELLAATSSLSPPPAAFSFASTFAPYAHVKPTTRRSVGGSSAAASSMSAIPSPMSAPASLGKKPSPTQSGSHAGVPERVVNVTVAEMESVLHDMQGLLHRVRSLQENYETSTSITTDDEDEESMTTSGDVSFSESDTAVSSSSDSPLPSPARSGGGGGGQRAAA